MSRVKRIALATARDYRKALASFSPNARWLLTSISLTDFALGMILTVFTVYVKAAGLSEFVVGSVEGTISLATAIGCLLVPVVIARQGYRRAFVGAVLVLGAARLGQAALPYAAPLLALGALYGLGDSITQGATVPFLSEFSAEGERPHLFSAELIVRVTAAFAGGLAGGFLPSLLQGATGALWAYRVTVGVSGLVMLAAAIPLLRIRDDRPRDGRSMRERVGSLRHFTSWGHVGRLVLPQVLISVGAGLIIPFLSLYLKNGLGASIGEVGVIQGVSQLAMGMALVFAPVLARRFGLVRSTVLVETMSLPFMIMIPFITDIRVAALVLWVRAALMNLSWPVWNQFSMEGVPALEKPTVAVILVLAWNAARFAGSVAGGRIMTVSYTTPYFYATVLYAIGTLATWLLNKDRDVKPGLMLASLPEEGQL